MDALTIAEKREFQNFPQGGEGRDEGGLKTIMPTVLCVATKFFKTLYGRHILTRSTKIEMHPRSVVSGFIPGVGGNPHVIKLAIDENEGH